MPALLIFYKLGLDRKQFNISIQDCFPEFWCLNFFGEFNIKSLHSCGYSASICSLIFNSMLRKSLVKRMNCDSENNNVISKDVQMHRSKSEYFLNKGTLAGNILKNVTITIMLSSVTFIALQSSALAGFFSRATPRPWQH